MNLIFLNPDGYKHLWPLALTRPVADLRIGILTIAEKWERRLGVKGSHHVTGHLSEVFPCHIGEDNLIVAGNLLPDDDLVEQLTGLKPGQWMEDEEGSFVCARLDHENALSLFSVAEQQDAMKAPALTGMKKLTGKVSRIRKTWDIFMKNGTELEADYELITRGRNSSLPGEGCYFIGDRIFIEEGARVQCAVLNSTSGPVYVGRDAEIMEGALIRGPFALCDHATVKLGAKIYGPTTVGPHCKVGGELNNVILQANANKAHDGFLGNAVIGEWCNLGADTNNSNLKNTYAEVRLWDYATNGFARTGSIFCGLVMGDHAKCGINTMFNTGTVVGVGANVFGSGYPRQFIPDFAWGGASGFKTFRFEEFIETARTVMSRRNAVLDEPQLRMLRNVMDMTAQYRNWE